MQTTNNEQRFTDKDFPNRLRLYDLERRYLGKRKEGERDEGNLVLGIDGKKVINEI